MKLDERTQKKFDEWYDAHIAIASRRQCAEWGYEQALKDNDILYGKDAQEFAEQIAHPTPNPARDKILKEAKELVGIQSDWGECDGITHEGCGSEYFNTKQREEWRLLCPKCLKQLRQQHRSEFAKEILESQIYYSRSDLEKLLKQEEGD